MRPIALAAAALVAILLVAGIPPGPVTEAEALPNGLTGIVKLQSVASGLTRPIVGTHAGDGSGRFFIGQQGGLVKVLKNGVLSDYFSVPAKCCGEQGLLGLAFHPNFENNGLLFVSYTQLGGNVNVIQRFQASPPATGTPVAKEIIISVTNQAGNHNGGWLAFGPDGYLYWSKGDGGGAGDPEGDAQNINNLLGKMLRLDIDVASGYAIPAGNPYAGATPGRDEIWSIGLRNPWRNSFDRQTGDLWIGDVGQNFIEEIDFQPAGQGGQNWGWRAWEGHYPYTPTQAISILGATTFPVYEYFHFVGQGAPACAVIGGYVYRGTQFPALQGLYFFSDNCSGTLSAAVAATALSGQLAPVTVAQGPGGPYSFGEDEAGELYIMGGNGNVYHIVMGP